MNFTVSPAVSGSENVNLSPQGPTQFPSFKESHTSTGVPPLIDAYNIKSTAFPPVAASLP